MKRYRVGYEPEAQNDLDDIYGWIAREAGLSIADGFLSRLNDYCEGLQSAPFRSPARDDIRPGLRIVTFEKAVSITYLIGEDRVDIVRFFYRGRSLTTVFDRRP